MSGVRELIQYSFTHPKYYLEHFLTIRNKQGKLQKLLLKPAQLKLYNTIADEMDAKRPVRVVILKARQLGFSTFIEGFFFQDTATRSNVRTMIVAHNVEATTNLFRMNKLFFDRLPEFLKPMRKASNAKEIIFENPTQDQAEKLKNPGLMSSIKCVPATGSSVGRSDTLTNVHASEVAFWGDMDETFTALLQAVPDDPSTCVIIETTPNGYNSFKDFWDRSVEGKTGFKAVFFAWYEDPEYRRPVEPNTKWTNEELEMKKAYGLDDEQLAWRRWCIATNMGGDEEKFKQEYPICPEEAFLTSGNPFFNNGIILRHLNILPKEYCRGRFIYGEDSTLKPIDIAFSECEDGEVYLYERPLSLHPYVVGGDTSGDGSDRFTAYMIDNSTGVQVAQILYDGGSELYYSQQMYCLQQYYNEALVGIEINFSTYPEKMLESWGARRLYIREKTDDSRGLLESYKLGWRTDLRTRPLILAHLQTLIAQNVELIRSEEVLRECLTFIRNDDMRPEAAEGSHDDLVMACAICYYIREQQTYEVAEEPTETYTKLIDRLDPKHKRRRYG